MPKPAPAPWKRSTIQYVHFGNKSSNLAVEMLKDNTHSTCYICTDSQAAIKAVNNPHRQSGQTIIKELLDSVDETTSQHLELQIVIVWIPGHSEIDGNERVDAEAKKAAIEPTLGQPFNHKPLKSAHTRNINSGGKETMAQRME